MLKQVQKNARELEDKIVDKFAGTSILFAIFKDRILDLGE